ncbi:MAG: hypothetical protein ACQEXJ_07265 [Myxococcota bacterium]
MDDRDPPTDRVDELVRRVEDLERRLRRLERREAAVAPTAAPVAPAPEEEATSAGAEGTAGLIGGVPPGALVTMLGRTCLALGGAWLLRAAVEQGGLGLTLGVILGLAYAAVWHVAADRAAQAKRHASALFHGLAAAAIGAPIVWENTVRNGLLAPDVAAPVLAGLGLLALAVAWRGGMQWYALVNILAVCGAGLTLMVQTHDFLPFGLVLLGLGGAAVAMSHLREWRILPWLAVVPLDLGVCLAVIWLRNPNFALRLDTPEVGLLFASIWAVFAGLVAWRGLHRRGFIGRFDVAQMLFAFVAGYEGAHWLFDGDAALALAGAALVVGAAWWIVALAAARRLEEGEDLDFFSGPHEPYVLGGFALLMVLDGSGRVLPLPIAGILWGALAVLAVHGVRRGLRFLEPFAVLFAAAATVGSGLMVGAWDALAGPAEAAWRPLLAFEPLVTLGALAAAFCLLPRRPGERPLAETAVGVLVLGGLGGVLVTLLAGPVASAPGAGAHAGVLAVLRTAIIAASALVLAFVYRRTGQRGLAWLTVAALAAGGVKLVMQDLAAAGAGLLFLSFALYGLALILAPRIVRGTETGSEASSES